MRRCHLVRLSLERMHSRVEWEIYQSIRVVIAQVITGSDIRFTGLIIPLCGLATFITGKSI